jgi:hypothetical protein
MTPELDILKKIKKVEAPDSLYANILSRIDFQKKDKKSNQWIYAIAASIVIVFCIDVFVIVQKTNNQEEELEGLHEIFNESNQLYYEPR